MYTVTVNFPDKLQANAFAMLFETDTMADFLNEQFQKVEVPEIEPYSSIQYDESDELSRGGHVVDVD
ncbi:hypothetical protein QNI22_07565 [Cytophagaceae bacterium BD1B2-1]|uniref:Uncharacterized protein n=2 Tax=Xanthocytophaga agilis TaxID=3048010 RepID=A0AAE3QYR2_9BACT|nr:hypothetical protein [Xanthocytophaga agilis]